MRDLKSLILEKLRLKDNDDYKNDVDPNDPSTWDIGDIVCCIRGYSMSLPRFYKITKKTPKSIVVKEMVGKIVSGHRNGQWEEVADETKPLGDEYRGRIIQKGDYKYVRIDGHSVRLWNGEPLLGDDMD